MLATALQLAGLAAVTVGAFMLVPWAGVIVGGAALVWIGLALESPNA